MALLTVTEAAKAVGVSRTTLYEKIKAGDLSRNSEKQIDTADLLRVFGELKTPSTEHTASTEHAQPDINLSNELLDMVQSKDAELDALRSQLNDTEQRLNEHREAAKALMSPEDFQARLSAAVDREKNKVLAEQRQRETQQVEKWKQAMADRKREVEQARAEAAEIQQREQKQSEALKAERKRLAELESRGFIARLLNKKPASVG